MGLKYIYTFKVTIIGVEHQHLIVVWVIGSDCPDHGSRFDVLLNAHVRGLAQYDWRMVHSTVHGHYRDVGLPGKSSIHSLDDQFIVV